MLSQGFEGLDQARKTTNLPCGSWRQSARLPSGVLRLELTDLRYGGHVPPVSNGGLLSARFFSLGSSCFRVSRPAPSIGERQISDWVIAPASWSAAGIF